MSIEERNKAIIADFCKDHSERNFVKLRTYATSDATWWVSGRQDRFPDGGEHSYAWLVDRLQDFLGGFEKWEFNITAMVAEGERVIIEATGRGDGPKGKIYTNNYIKHFGLSDGKITSVREYHDPFQYLVYNETEAR